MGMLIEQSLNMHGDAMSPAKKDAQNETQQRLLDGAISALRDYGFAGVSARTVARFAGVNQALIFYHFGSINELISRACYVNTTERVNLYRERIGQVDSIVQLLEVGQFIHELEYEAGNVAVLAQVLAGAQQHPELATAAQQSLQVWIDVLHDAVAPLIERSPLKGLVDSVALAETAAAAFIGMELYQGAKPSSTGDPFAALRPLAVAAGLIDNLNPMTKKAIRSQLVRANRKANAKKPAAKK